MKRKRGRPPTQKDLEDLDDIPIEEDPFTFIEEEVKQDFKPQDLGDFDICLKYLGQKNIPSELIPKIWASWFKDVSLRLNREPPTEIKIKNQTVKFFKKGNNLNMKLYLVCPKCGKLSRYLYVLGNSIACHPCTKKSFPINWKPSRISKQAPWSVFNYVFSARFPQVYSERIPHGLLYKEIYRMAKEVRDHLERKIEEFFAKSWPLGEKDKTYYEFMKNP